MQLLESVLNLVIFAVLLVLYKKSLAKKFLYGKLIFFYLIMYSVARFSDEFLRGDVIRGFILGMSTSQFISIFVLTLGICLIIKYFLSKNKTCRVK